MTNDRFPLQPDYVGPDSGMFLFAHHDRLYEYVWSAKERADYIRSEKLPYQQAIRSNHFCLLRAEDVPEISPETWLKADWLRAESDRLLAGGNRLWDESIRLRYEGERLWEPYHAAIEAAAHRLIPDCR